VVINWLLGNLHLYLLDIYYSKNIENLTSTSKNIWYWYGNLIGTQMISILYVFTIMKKINNQPTLFKPNMWDSTRAKSSTIGFVP